MKVRFLYQVLIGTRVYAEGEVVDAPEGLAAHALAHGLAVEHAVPAEPPAREAVSPAPAQARKAVKR